MKTVILIILITVLILGFIGSSRWSWEITNRDNEDIEFFQFENITTNV